MATSPITKLFAQSDVLSRLQDHANRLIRLQRKLDLALPAASRGAVRVANLQEGVLTVHVTSPVMATRLKLGLESLKASLQAAGEPIHTITVKVRVSPFEGLRPLAETGARPISSESQEALRQLSNDLNPEDPLAQALQRLISRCAED